LFGDAAQYFRVSALCFTACHALLREASVAREAPGNLQPHLHGTIVAAFTLLAADEVEDESRAGSRVSGPSGGGGERGVTWGTRGDSIGKTAEAVGLYKLLNSVDAIA
jgi:hypothetical protein